MNAELARLLGAVQREQTQRPRPLPVRDLREVVRLRIARADAVIAAGARVLRGVAA